MTSSAKSALPASAVLVAVSGAVSFAQAAECPPGQFGFYPNGCVPAPAGQYLPIVGATSGGSLQPAPVGTYVPTQGATAPTLAPPGSYVPSIGATAPTLAQPGTYVPIAGASSPTLAPAGTYVPSVGATAPTVTSPGTYSNMLGASAPTLAPAGSYVSVAGSTSPSWAQPGYFVPNAGASAPTLAPAGYFVNQSGATAPTPAPAGSLVPLTGSTSAQACPLGSNSYGAAAACRAISPTSLTSPHVVTPLFYTTLGVPGQLVEGLHLLNNEPLTFQAGNLKHGQLAPSLLTDVTLLDASITGPGADQFTLEGFTAGMVLRQERFTTFSLQPSGRPKGLFDITLSIRTDQFANPGQSGAVFNYRLQGITLVTAVPEPGTWILLLAGAGVVGLWRRHASGTQPPA